MSEPTPPGSAPQEPSYQPPVAPPSQPPAAPPPPFGGGYSAGPPIGGNVAPVGYATNEEKTWALVAHFGGAAAAFISAGYLGWVPPLVAMLVKGNESPTVRAHAVAALNFQLLWTIVAVVGWITACFLIGFLILGLAILMSAIFGIIAGIKANEGQLYAYPASPKIVK
jgi:uncharacterized protein